MLESESPSAPVNESTLSPTGQAVVNIDEEVDTDFESEETLATLRGKLQVQLEASSESIQSLENWRMNETFGRVQNLSVLDMTLASLTSCNSCDDVQPYMNAESKSLQRSDDLCGRGDSPKAHGSGTRRAARRMYWCITLWRQHARSAIKVFLLQSGAATARLRRSRLCTSIVVAAFIVVLLIYVNKHQVGPSGTHFSASESLPVKAVHAGSRELRHHPEISSLATRESSATTAPAVTQAESPVMASCHSSKKGDSSTMQCNSFCNMKASAFHCQMCKCKSCDFCSKTDSGTKRRQTI